MQSLIHSKVKLPPKESAYFPQIPRRSLAEESLVQKEHASSLTIQCSLLTMLFPFLTSHSIFPQTRATKNCRNQVLLLQGAISQKSKINSANDSGTNRVMHYSPREVVPQGVEGGLGEGRGGFCPRGTVGAVWRHCGCHIRGVLLSSSGQRPGTRRNILQCRGLFPMKNYSAQNVSSTEVVKASSRRLYTSVNKTCVPRV